MNNYKAACQQCTNLC